MNEFRKYMHIAPIGHSDTKGILTGTVVIQPKIDGENYQLGGQTDSRVMVLETKT